MRSWRCSSWTARNSGARRSRWRSSAVSRGLHCHRVRPPAGGRRVGRPTRTDGDQRSVRTHAASPCGRASRATAWRGSSSACAAQRDLPRAAEGRALRSRCRARATGPLHRRLLALRRPRRARAATSGSTTASTSRSARCAGASTATCSEYAPSVWLDSVAFARTGPGKCNGLFVVRRGKLRRLDRRVPAETDLRGTQVAYLYIPPGDTFRSSLRVRYLTAAGRGWW